MLKTEIPRANTTQTTHTTLAKTSQPPPKGVSALLCRSRLTMVCVGACCRVMPRLLVCLFKTQVRFSNAQMSATSGRRSFSFPYHHLTIHPSRKRYEMADRYGLKR